ncbi:hypothetical protein ABLE68_09825 [Nocardioides sp. CN2-186]|uniref:hypothetical protein n=1 Tax=Nocardioides tweenelious TaxID=3156607 RepID=UPI0032B4C0AD
MTADSPRPTHRNPALLVCAAGIAIAVGSLLIFVVGLQLHPPEPVHCAADPVFCPSPRDRWDWATRGWFLGAFLLGVLVAWSGLVWRPISASPQLRRVGSVVGLMLCLPVSGLLVVVAIALAHTTCDPDSFCFGGREDALAVAVPATYGVALCLLMAIGLAYREDTRTGRVCGTLALCLVSGIGVLVAAGFTLSASSL